ncbi:MAG: hypothetical protein AAFO89_09775 [Planctomycetota bacterium]
MRSRFNWLLVVSLLVAGCAHRRTIDVALLESESRVTLQAISSMEHRLIDADLSDEEERQGLKNTRAMRRVIKLTDTMTAELARVDMKPDDADTFDSYLKMVYRHYYAGLQQPAEVFAQREVRDDDVEKWERELNALLPRLRRLK